MCVCLIGMGKVKHDYIRGSLKVAPVDEKFKNNRLTWYEHVEKSKTWLKSFKYGC